MKPPERSAVLIVDGQVSTEGGHNSHYTFQVTKHRPFKQWIFDVTGPQLNVFDPCLDLPTYTTNYVEKYRLTAPLGTARIYFEKVTKLRGLVALETRIEWDAVRAVERGIQDWQIGSNSNLPDLLRGSKSIFQRQERNLLVAVERSLNRFVASSDFESEMRVAKRYTMEHLGTVMAEVKALFNQHEEYLTQFKD
jgi:hypothetical protein